MSHAQLLASAHGCRAFWSAARDAVDVELTWYRDGEAQEDLTDAMVPGDRVQKGQSWRYTATASDGQATVVEESPTVVVQNTPPAVDAATAEPASPAAGQDVALSVDAVDVDGDALQVTWTLPDGTAVMPRPHNTSQWILPWTTSGGRPSADSCASGKMPLQRFR